LDKPTHEKSNPFNPGKTGTEISTSPCSPVLIFFWLALIIFIFGAILEPYLKFSPTSIGHEIFQNTRGIVFDVAIVILMFNWI